MKKSLFTSAILLLMVTCSSAQKNIPAPVKEAFSKKYAGVTPKWEKEGSEFEASFTHEGHKMSAVFAADGKITETEMEIKATELPAAAVAYVKEHYKDAKIKEAAKITKANGEVIYEAEVKGKDLLFDASGKFLKSE